MSIDMHHVLQENEEARRADTKEVVEKVNQGLSNDLAIITVRDEFSAVILFADVACVDAANTSHADAGGHDRHP